MAGDSHFATVIHKTGAQGVIQVQLLASRPICYFSIGKSAS